MCKSQNYLWASPKRFWAGAVYCVFPVILLWNCLGSLVTLETSCFGSLSIKYSKAVLKWEFSSCIGFVFSVVDSLHSLILGYRDWIIDWMRLYWDSSITIRERASVVSLIRDSTVLPVFRVRWIQYRARISYIDSVALVVTEFPLYGSQKCPENLRLIESMKSISLRSSLSYTWPCVGFPVTKAANFSMCQFTRLTECTIKSLFVAKSFCQNMRAFESRPKSHEVYVLKFGLYSSGFTLTRAEKSVYTAPSTESS